MQSALFLLLHHDLKPLNSLLRILTPCYLDPLAISIAKQTKFFRSYLTSHVLLEQQKKDEGERMHPPAGEWDLKGETYEPKVVVK